MPLVLAKLDTPAGVLPGNVADHLTKSVVSHKALDRTVGLFKLFVGEDLMDGSMTVATKRQCVLAATAFGHEVMIRRV
jgi:hypothetical protein